MGFELPSIPGQNVKELSAGRQATAELTGGQEQKPVKDAFCSRAGYIIKVKVGA
jgi:hypothetical protein